MPVASVARRLGVAPSTLRTWDRRYGLGPSRHTGGRHRRYGPDDIGRLELMQRALLRGASTAEAARYALERMPKSEQPGGPVPAEPSVPTASLRIETSDGDVVLPAEEPPHARGDGAHPGLARLARRLSTAALAMDAPAVQQTLAEAITGHGVLDAWEGVLAPVLEALSGGRQRSQTGAEVHYLLTECVFAALVRATPVLADPRNERPVFLGCVPGERNGLPLYVLAAAFGERRVVTQLFGGPLPADVLTVAVRRSAPAAVVLWAQRGSVVEPRLFTRILRGRQRSRLFAYGPGWAEGDLPGKVELLGGLRDAVDRIEYVLLGGAPGAQ
ncbi:MerR family transcriptional regulator [Qaidamihabitans albus]|uniref:MerR family transcriptional regulator n=1 Tax=Qaidamihabitans albus TaxID=2795733 RepID=UPI001F244780